jgi:predicted outer membrane repeat protein
MKKRENQSVWLAMSMFLLLMVSTATAEIIFVDDNATGANDGSSWTDAYNYLQHALAAASSGDEIWVAQGIYTPDQGAGVTPGDRTATFQLISGVTLKGGYAGFGEPDPNARNIELYETILSGDLSDNDGPNFANNYENSYQVVTAYEVDETTCLEGFTISGGNANGKSGFSFTGYDGNDGGGGMLINASWPTEHSSPIISNCLFRDNRAVYGAGIYSYRGPATIENCIFEGNIAERNGGGIYSVLGGGTKIVKSCRFIDNQAFSGGGLHYFYSRATVTNCVFAGNFAHFDGSAIVSPTGTVTNCTFYGNHVDDDTAVVVNGMGELYIINSILWDDTHSEGYYEIAALTYVYISHCDVRGGEAGVYIHPWGLGDILNWGPGNIDADPCFVDPGYWDTNSTHGPPPSPPGPPPGPPLALDVPYFLWVDGDYHLLPGSPCIDAGDPNYPYDPNETDLDGNPRVISGRIDMGAYESPVPAEVRIVPRSINLASKGKWITCYIQLPEDCDVADIEPNSVLLEGEIEAQSLVVDEEKQVAVARFNRPQVQAILAPGEVELTVSGELTGGTSRFEGTDNIRVIDKGAKNENGKKSQHLVVNVNILAGGGGR